MPCRGSGLQSVGGLTRGQMSGLVLCWVNQPLLAAAHVGALADRVTRRKSCVLLLKKNKIK